MTDTPTTSVPVNAYLSIEWQINGTWGSHADQVWSDYTGTGVIVTDLDDGFQIAHPDITANYRTDLDYDFESHDSDASATNSGDNHGTSVLGLMIGTGAGGAGALGVAYGAEGFGIRMGFGSDGDLDQISGGFNYARTEGAAVMNNSWGFSDPFSDDFGYVSGAAYFDGIATAMKSYADHGRGDLGGIIVFAAGNYRADGDNTNYHNQNSSPYVITVAAIDSTGHYANFSTAGTSILVSAAGVNDVTTDRTGAAGYVTGDYVYFSGTSAATPVVSGVVALMLQANSNLGWRDVQDILAYSAQHNDPASAGWQTNGATNWNGGGLHYSADYGFGAVDAFTAVRLAETWNMQSTSANMMTVNSATDHANLAITTAMQQSTITVAQNINTEHVEVNLNLTDTNLSGLTVTLIAPSGTHSLLIDHPAAGTDTNTIQFQTLTVADWGEASAGTWTLDVQDADGTATGVLSSWSLSFLGSAASSNQTLIYTNDFAALSGPDLTARSVIGNGAGTDTLNLAAVTSNSTIDLNAGTGIIGGHAVTIAGGTVINTVYGGDGNDKLTGNHNDDYLYGGRGNDIIVVTGGTDHIDGGAGADTVIYSEDVGNFAFAFTDPTHQTIADTAGTLGTDMLANVENFSFNGTVYTLAQLQTYADAHSGSIIALTPAQDDIMVSLPNGRYTSLNYDSNADGTHVFTAADLGVRGTAAWISLERHDNDLTIDVLNKKVTTHFVTLAGGDSDENILFTGYSPKGMNTDITLGNGNNHLSYNNASGATIHMGEGDNVIANAGSTALTGGGGDNTVTLGNLYNIVQLGDGDNSLTLGNGRNFVTLGDGNNTVLVGKGVNTITVGGGENTINDGAGRNYITAGNGNNIFNIGHGKDVITAGNGDDHYVFTGAVAATIENFDANKGDSLDISALLHAYDPLTQAIESFVHLSTSRGSTVLSIDTNGRAHGAHFATVAVIAGAGMDLHTLIDTGHLVVH